MSEIVQGVAAVLHTPMRGKPVRFGAPGPFPCLAGAPIAYQRTRVGEVLALWVENDRVHWIGQLDVRPFILPEHATDVRVPLPEPSVRDMIDGAWLVGVPALTQARTEREDGCMVLVGWTVNRMQLLRPADAPWPGLTLNLR